MSSCFNCHRFAHDYGPVYHEWFNKQRPEDYEFVMDPHNRRTITRSIPDLQDLLAETLEIAKSESLTPEGRLDAD